jgi:hypothetical protein
VAAAVAAAAEAAAAVAAVAAAAKTLVCLTYQGVTPKAVLNFQREDITCYMCAQAGPVAADHTDALGMQKDVCMMSASR